MWEGLVAPDPQRWRQGAQVYARAVDCKPIAAGQAVPEHHTVPCNTILAVAGAAALLYFAVKADRMARIGAGYKAKIACSETFLAGRDP